MLREREREREKMKKRERGKDISLDLFYELKKEQRVTCRRQYEGVNNEGGEIIQYSFLIGSTFFL